VEKKKVRFAPSPTGYLHVGGARTALFNWLYVRKNKDGNFVLRIEDTDFQRSTKKMSEKIVESMKWLDLLWDEGPFYQSERLDIYKKHVKELIKTGKAYYCFCSPEQIRKRREKAKSENIKSWKYDRKCLELNGEQVKNNLENNKKHAIRFKVPPGVTEFNDIIHGRVKVKNSSIEDFVLVKSDGTPTYHLSVTVDDHLMKITTIIRGDDHLSNTPKQIMLYKAFGWNIPEFAHLPLILGVDGQKLSKRHGINSVLNYKELGYLPISIINFLARLSWNPGDDRPFFKREELIERFSLKKISKNSPVFDIKKLNFINSKVISSIEREQLYEMMIEYIQIHNNKKKEYSCILNADRRQTLKAIELLKTRMKSLKQFVKALTNYLGNLNCKYEERAVKKYFKKKSDLYLKKFLKELKKINNNDFTPENLEKVLRNKAELENIKPAEIIHPLRVALTGSKVSPGIFKVLSFFGKKETMKRIEAAINYIGNMSIKK